MDHLDRLRVRGRRRSRSAVKRDLRWVRLFHAVVRRERKRSLDELQTVFGAVLATELIRPDRRGLRCPAVVDVKPTEHARDYDRLGRVDGHHGSRRYALAKPLVRATLVEVALVLTKHRREVQIASEQHVIEQFFDVRSRQIVPLRNSCSAPGPRFGSPSRRLLAPRGRTPARTCRRDPAAARPAHPRPLWRCATAVRSMPASDDASLQRGPRAATQGGR